MVLKPFNISPNINVGLMLGEMFDRLNRPFGIVLVTLIIAGTANMCLTTIPTKQVHSIKDPLLVLFTKNLRNDDNFLALLPKILHYSYKHRIEKLNMKVEI